MTSRTFRAMPRPARPGRGGATASPAAIAAPCATAASGSTPGARSQARHALEGVAAARHPARPAHQQHFIQHGAAADVVEHALHELLGAGEQACGEPFELCLLDRDAMCPAGDVQRHRGARHPRQCMLGFARALLKLGDHRQVVPRVRAERLLHAIGDEVDEDVVPVLAAEAVVAGGRQHLVSIAPEAHHRHVEGAAAEVVDEDRPRAVAVGAVGQARRRRFVQQRQHLEAGELRGLLRRAAGVVSEVCGDRDHGLQRLPAAFDCGVGRQRLEDLGRELRRRPRAIPGRDLPGRSHRALEEREGHVGIQRGEPLGLLADLDLAALVDRHHRAQPGRAVAQRIERDVAAVVRLPDRRDRRAEVDAERAHASAPASLDRRPRNPNERATDDRGWRSCHARHSSCRDGDRNSSTSSRSRRLSP